MNTKIQLSTATFRIEYDPRYAHKQYPIMCVFYNIIVDDEILKKIESSRIVKADKDFLHHSVIKQDSSVLFIPQFGYDFEKFLKVMTDFLGKYEDEYQEQFDD